MIKELFGTLEEIWKDRQQVEQPPIIHPQESILTNGQQVDFKKHLHEHTPLSCCVCFNQECSCV